MFFQVRGNCFSDLFFVETLREKQSASLLMKVGLCRVNVSINKTRHCKSTAKINYAGLLADKVFNILV